MLRHNLSGLNLGYIDLGGCTMRGCKLQGADLSNADLSNCNLSGANLSGADLSNADIINCKFSGANLDGANLSECVFTVSTSLSSASLRGADLSRTEFEPGSEGSDLRENADITDAILDGARGSVRIDAGTQGIGELECINHLPYDMFRADSEVTKLGAVKLKDLWADAPVKKLATPAWSSLSTTTRRARSGRIPMLSNLEEAGHRAVPRI
eukprot:scaffold38295_cov49-Phaeocystis_antarctica.AAC.1